MRRGVQAGAEFLDERNRAALQIAEPKLLGFGFVPALNSSKEHGENIRDEAFVVGHPIPDFDRQAKDPLPHRHMGEDVVHQVSGGIGHAPSHA